MNTQLIEKCYKEGLRRYPFWVDRKRRLKNLLLKIKGEIQEIEDAAQSPVTIAEKTALKVKAIWCLSGSGSYSKPLLDSESDLRLKNLPWMHGTDRKRLDFCARLMQIFKLKGGNPILIYNGTEEQNKVFRQIASRKLDLNKTEWFIAPGKNVKTIDQVSNLKLPKSLTLKKSDIVGIVSHAAHLCRAIRMVNKFRPFPKDATIMLFPLVFSNPRDEEKSAFNEIMGILGYVSRKEISEETYPYEINRPTINLHGKM